MLSLSVYSQQEHTGTIIPLIISGNCRTDKNKNFAVKKPPKTIRSDE